MGIYKYFVLFWYLNRAPFVENNALLRPLCRFKDDLKLMLICQFVVKYEKKGRGYLHAFANIGRLERT